MNTCIDLCPLCIPPPTSDLPFLAQTPSNRTATLSLATPHFATHYYLTPPTTFTLRLRNSSLVALMSPPRSESGSGLSASRRGNIGQCCGLGSAYHERHCHLLPNRLSPYPRPPPKSRFTRIREGLFGDVGLFLKGMFGCRDSDGWDDINPTVLLRPVFGVRKMR